MKKNINSFEPNHICVFSLIATLFYSLLPWTWHCWRPTYVYRIIKTKDNILYKSIGDNFEFVCFKCGHRDRTQNCGDII